MCQKLFIILSIYHTIKLLIHYYCTLGKWNTRSELKKKGGKGGGKEGGGGGGESKTKDYLSYLPKSPSLNGTPPNWVSKVEGVKPWVQNLVGGCV